MTSALLKLASSSSSAPTEDGYLTTLLNKRREDRKLMDEITATLYRLELEAIKPGDDVMARTSQYRGYRKKRGRSGRAAPTGDDAVADVPAAAKPASRFLRRKAAATSDDISDEEAAAEERNVLSSRKFSTLPRSWRQGKSAGSLNASARPDLEMALRAAIEAPPRRLITLDELQPTRSAPEPIESTPAVARISIPKTSIELPVSVPFVHPAISKPKTTQKPVETPVEIAPRYGGGGSISRAGASTRPSYSLVDDELLAYLNEDVPTSDERDFRLYAGSGGRSYAADDRTWYAVERAGASRPARDEDEIYQLGQLLDNPFARSGRSASQNIGDDLYRLPYSPPTITTSPLNKFSYY